MTLNSGAFTPGSPTNGLTFAAAAAGAVAKTTQRAAALLALGRQAHEQGAALDPTHALPLYLRDKVALTTAERAAVRDAAASSR